MDFDTEIIVPTLGPRPSQCILLNPTPPKMAMPLGDPGCSSPWNQPLGVASEDLFQRVLRLNAIANVTGNGNDMRDIFQ